jgi:dCTP diphosphatase
MTDLHESTRLSSLNALRDALRQFAAERDWDQFHSPKNLSMALSVEVAELVEHMQWLTEEQSQNLPDKTHQEVTEELADTLMYLVRIADKLDVDLLAAASQKLVQNHKAYPAEKVRGSAKKYTAYQGAPEASD